MDDGGKSPEYETIRKHHATLVEAIALNLTELADRLFSGEFVSENVRNEVFNTSGISGSQRAGKLVENILHQIRVTPARFCDFIDILNSDSSRSDLSNKLEETLKGSWISY